MATFSSVTRQHVLQAIAEYDARGAEEFGSVYGFEPSTEHVLLHEGSRYDARAVLAVAHKYATGRLATPEEFRSSMTAAVGILQRRGFDVTGPAAVAAARPAKATRTPRAASTRTPATRSPAARARAAAEAPPALCPTCSMALPATGICDYCS